MRSRRIVIIVLLIAAAGAAWYFYTQQAAANGTLTLSGTIEATEVNLPTVKGGSVRGVNAAEGDKITAGQRLVDVHSETDNSNERIVGCLRHRGKQTSILRNLPARLRGY